jgi:pectinesterase
VGRQAVALMIEGDRAAFYRCNFYGAQDTLYDKQGRHYYYNSYIEGSVDFIFGDARSLFVVRIQSHDHQCLATIYIDTC